MLLMPQSMSIDHVLRNPSLSKTRSCKIVSRSSRVVVEWTPSGVVREWRSLGCASRTFCNVVRCSQLPCFDIKILMIRPDLRTTPNPKLLMRSRTAIHACMHGEPYDAV